jgi:limonene-1,2-epoxide hydrolase
MPTVPESPASEITAASEALVRDFCAAWSRRDIEELLGYFTGDAVYHNMPMAPVQGPDGIRAVMEFFVPGSEEIEFEVLALASLPKGQDSATVFTERVDRFVMSGKTVELPVAGVFEVRAGKIAAWRDYFDMATWSNQTA